MHKEYLQKTFYNFRSLLFIYPPYKEAIILHYDSLMTWIFYHEKNDIMKKNLLYLENYLEQKYLPVVFLFVLGHLHNQQPLLQVNLGKWLLPQNLHLGPQQSSVNHYQVKNICGNYHYWSLLSPKRKISIHACPQWLMCR